MRTLKFQLVWPLVLFPLLLIVAAHTPLAQTITARERIRDISNYVVYYGVGELTSLRQFDLAIIDPKTLTPEELTYLTETNTLVIAYLSLGEVNPNSPWFNDIDDRWIIGENGNWGSQFIDARQTGWQDIIREQTRAYLEAGFDGIFMDTIDTVDLFPETQIGMETLILSLRESYPDAILVQNRGVAVLPTTAPVIDGIMLESFVTSYNFDTKTYFPVNNSEIAELLQLVGVSEDIVLLALDYAITEDLDTVELSKATASQYGFIPYVSEITLQSIPFLNVFGHPVEASTPPRIVEFDTVGGCPTFEGIVEWEDDEGDIAGIIVAWGSDDKGVDGAEPYTNQIFSTATSDIWRQELHLQCNPINDGCNVRVEAIDIAGNRSEIERTYHKCNATP